MDIFDYEDYKGYVVDRLKRMPRAGHGQWQKIAHAIGVQSAFLSQVFRGSKQLTIEQGYLLARYFGLSSLESEFLIQLIQLERATSGEYKDFVLARLTEIKSSSRKMLQTPVRFELDPVKQSIFYSSWFYSAVHLLTSIESYQDFDSMAGRIALPRDVLQQVLGFLFEAGLVDMKNGRYTIKTMTTKIENNRPLSIRHNTNWRFKAVEKLSSTQSQYDFFHSNQVSLSKEDAKRIHNLISELKIKVMAIVKESPAEELFCFNMDWFQI